MKQHQDARRSQHGFALIMSLMILFALMALAGALMLVTQSEVLESASYRNMAQARYAAEAGAQATMNWLLYSYTAPTSAQLSSYNLNTYPVEDSATSNAIVLSAMTSVSSNYPDSTQQSAFNSALNDASVPGLGIAASYQVTAKLLSMNASAVTWLGGTGGAIQTWQITSQANVAGIRSTQVQVTMNIQRTGTPIFAYGVEALGTACQSVYLSGGKVDSWNSAAGSYSATHQNSGATLATNGNLTMSGGSALVYGAISNSSNITVGNCPDGITNNVGGTPWLGLNTLSKPLTAAAPDAPSPMTPNTNINSFSNTCWGASPAGCTVLSSTSIKIAPGSYGNLTSNSNVHLSAGTYYFNSVGLIGGSMTLDSYPVVINLGGNGISGGGTLFTSNSSTTINDGGIPSNLQIVSAAGAGLSSPPVISTSSSLPMYAVVYAPNAYVHLTGSSQFLGAVIGLNVTSDNSGGFSYDLALQNGLSSPGPYYPISFSRSKF